MEIKKVEFIKSSAKYQDCPKEDLPEFALIGRSNVGKSSLLNMLFNNKKLAKVSSMPGKTQLINHFMIDNKWFMVDLPGYGWSKVSKKKRYEWKKMIDNYLLKSKNLYLVFVLLDSRLEPQQIDIDFINWLGENKVPLALIFTKIDKLNKNDLIINIEKVKKELQLYWEELPKLFVTSSIKKVGQNEIIDFIFNSLQT